MFRFLLDLLERHHRRITARYNARHHRPKENR